MHLNKPGFTYSVCSPFTKNEERIQKFTEIGNTDFIYRNDLVGTCFQHDVAYDKYKDLTKRTQSDKVFGVKAFEIAGNSKDDGYQRGFASIVYQPFDKKSTGTGVTTLPNKSAMKSMPN